jgi:aryl carrier-like protein
VHLESLPLTPNGKLDRKALPAPESDAYSTRVYEAPQDETESFLAEVWAELLGVERVGRHDNFFELGGHSLLAVRTMTRIREKIGVTVTLDDIFTHPTISELTDSLITMQLKEYATEDITRLINELY